MAVAAAIQLMHESGTDCLLVCDEGRLVGIFTDRDAAVKAVDKRLGLFRVRDFMTHDPVVLQREDTVAVAIHKMAVGEFRHIPILDNGRPMGVVTAPDVFRHIVASLG
jgi:CBS domain-containing protein